MKDQAIADFKAKIAQAQDDAASALYDTAHADGVADAPQSGLQQADLDKAVAAQVAKDQAQEATDLTAAHADAQAKLDALQAQVDQITQAKSAEDQKLAADETVVQGLNNSIAALQGALDSLKALFPVVPPAQPAAPAAPAAPAQPAAPAAPAPAQ